MLTNFKRLTVLATLLFLSFTASADKYSFLTFSPTYGYPNNVNTIFVEDGGFAWIGADDGLYLITSTNTFIHYTTNNAEAQRVYLPGNKVLKVMGDNSGIIWVLTDNGFVGYKTELQSGVPGIQPILPPETITAYSIQVLDDNVYFGCENKVWSYNDKTGEFTLSIRMDSNPANVFTNIQRGYNKDLLLFNQEGEFFVLDTETGTTREVRLSARNCYAAYTDSRGFLWLSVFDQGVYCMNKDGKEVAHYTTLNSKLTSDLVLCFEECDGNLWMGTDGGGICILDFATGKISSMQHNIANPYSLPEPSVASMFCDANSRVWCGSYTGGVFVVSKPKIDFYPLHDFATGTNTKGVSSFFQDGPSDQIWIGTNGNGLYGMNPKNGEFTKYFETAGMYIYNIAKVNQNILALSCPRGFYRLNKNTGTTSSPVSLGQLKNYYMTNGEGACVDNDEDGRIYTYAKNILRFNPANNKTEVFNVGASRYSLNHIHPVTGSACKYAWDQVSLYKWNELLDNKLEVLYTQTDGSVFSCVTLNNNGSVIYVAIGSRVYEFDTETSQMQENPLELDSPVSTIVCDLKGQIWIGTRAALYYFNPNPRSLVRLTDADGVYTNEYSLHANLVAANGDVYIGGSNGFVRIRSDFKLPPISEPKLYILSVGVDGKLVSKNNLKIPHDHSSVVINLFAQTNDIMQPKRYLVESKSVRGMEFAKELTQPVIRMGKLSYGYHTIRISATMPDGRWGSDVLSYTFKVAYPWYLYWWVHLIFFAAVVFAIVFFINRRVRRRRRNLKMREAIEKERYNFLINVNHELRTPLTLISGPLRRFLKDPDLDPKYKESVTRICRQAEKMTNLLNTVLTTNKLQEGLMQVHIKPVAINPWLKNCADEFVDEAQSMDMMISYKLNPNAGAVMMDDALCKIVFYNIMSNALKHNEHGHHITIWSGFSNEENGMLRIGIRDHGSGIGDVEVDKLFERYYQATEERSGFGIGLSYSKTIIDAHHGNIGAYNNPDGPGATFWFELPMSSEDVSEAIFEAQVEEAHNSNVDTARKGLRDKTLLFVDDNADLRVFIDEEFRSVCGKLLLAYNGKNALEVLKENKVDAIVTDVMMPEMDGIELCNYIKNDPKYYKIPVIMLTAKTDSKTREISSIVKADYYMPKPFETEHLITTLDFLCRQAADNSDER